MTRKSKDTTKASQNTSRKSSTLSKTQSEHVVITAITQPAEAAVPERRKSSLTILLETALSKLISVVDSATGLRRNSADEEDFLKNENEPRLSVKESQEALFSDKYTLHLPTDISQDLSELAYLRRENEEARRRSLGETSPTSPIPCEKRATSLPENGASQEPLLSPITVVLHTDYLQHQDEGPKREEEQRRKSEDTFTTKQSLGSHRITNFLFPNKQARFDDWARSLSMHEIGEHRDHVCLLHVPTSISMTSVLSCGGSWFSS